jgi:hypothetical protein
MPGRHDDQPHLDGAMFDTLSRVWAARPIANCPGRFVLSTVPSTTAPGDLVGPNFVARECNVAAARDTVLVTELPDCGLISYRRADGSYLHTLNTLAGFKRKLVQLGIEPDSC